MASKAESSKLGSDLSELQKSNLDLQRRHVQFQHELRRKDKEFERLQVDNTCMRILDSVYNSPPGTMEGGGGAC